MKIEFLAHAAFLITREQGMRVLLDPYESGGFSGRVGYDQIREESDVVVITHDHLDHCHTKTLPGEFEVIRYEGSRDGLTVRSVQAFHDQEQGQKFGGIIDMKVLEFDGWKICHCGDIGETLDDPKKVEAIGQLDVLIIPVGGFYTVDAKLAFEVTKKLSPKIVIPCHYKTLSCGFDIAPKSEFTTLFQHQLAAKGSMFTLSRQFLSQLEGSTHCLSMEMKYDNATEQVIGSYRPRS